MRKCAPLAVISLVLLWESQQSALPFVLLVLCQSKSQNCSFYCGVWVTVE